MSPGRQIDFDPTIDFYQALGVGKKASSDEIKKAYRKLAKAYHPDSTGGDKAKESRFKEISNAYEVLGDTKKRKQYDELREYGFRGPGNGAPGGFQGFGGQAQGFDLNDLFGQFFRGQAGRGGKVRVERVDFEPGGGDPFGRARGGRAEPAQDAEFESRVQASDGSWLTVRGVDVYSDVRIPWDRAILGTVVEVATVDGKAKVKIPPGTSSGTKLRLRGKGVSDGVRQGDHYVTVQIDVPDGAKLYDDTKREIVELAQKLRKSKK